MGRFKGPRGTFFFGLLIIIILIAYYSLANETKAIKEEDTVVTPVANILMQDLSKNYPPTPKEVMRLYCEITKCFYNETYTEEELQGLAFKAKELYDNELAEVKDDNTYLNDLKVEIEGFKKNGWTISNYSLSSSTDVEYFEEDGYKFARLYSTYYIRSGSSMNTVEQVYIFRKDNAGHWKIYGWDIVSEGKGNNS
ncbi:MAG: DUF6715 family protein [Lachnospiraceae bacterium]